MVSLLPAVAADFAPHGPSITSVAITAGYDHTCVLTTGGGVKCWGLNFSGRLGDGTMTDRPLPVDVVGLTTGVEAIAAGTTHTCALTTAGSVKCWGNNYYGQLGDNRLIDAPAPVDVIGLTNGISAVAAGGEHSCALTTAGSVQCWGGNRSGELGDGTTANRGTPVAVLGLADGVTAIAAGYQHTCALTTAGSVKCWGENGDGQLGNGSLDDQLAPVGVIGLTTGVQAIGAGYDHTCVLTMDGGVKCWGDNFYGQLGDGTTDTRLTPVDVTGLTRGVVAISTGSWHTCALTTAGGVKCWGRNLLRTLGDGSTLNRPTPVDVTGLTSGLQAIAAGGEQTCALTTTGGVKCWGDNTYGQLGNGTTRDRLLPVGVSGLPRGIRAIAAGDAHTCALTPGGGVKCWGDNLDGALGDGTTTSRWLPADVIGLTAGVQAIAAGATHTCVLTTGGGVKCWGSNISGQLGNGTTLDRLTPTDVIGLTSGVQAISAGGSHTCALTTAGRVLCWGRNWDGELGDGTTFDRLTRVDVAGLTSGVQAIAASHAFTCALTTAGGAKCWGNNIYGRLGDGTWTARLTPVDVLGLTAGVQAIAPGETHTCALTTAGGVKCWGLNYLGQLGNDSTSITASCPGDVNGLTAGVQAIAAGWAHTCALAAPGGVTCWGANSLGALGDGTQIDRRTPVDVAGLTSGVQAISAGGQSTCALTTAGAVKCWGDNADGQLGVDPGWAPVDVVFWEPPAMYLPYISNW